VPSPRGFHPRGFHLDMTGMLEYSLDFARVMLELGDLKLEAKDATLLKALNLLSPQRRYCKEKTSRM
jgi:hypothetical protein